MSFNIFIGGRNQESVAYDLALSLATKDKQVTTPEELIQKIAELLPLCREAAEQRYKSEKKKPFTIPDDY